jgi:hypothetical protein
MTSEPIRYRKNLSVCEERALYNLKKRRDIVVKEADKGSAVVVMDRARYIAECKRQLEDTSVYMPLTADPSKENFRSIKILLDRMLEIVLITEDQANFALPLFFYSGLLLSFTKGTQTCSPGSSHKFSFRFSYRKFVRFSGFSHQGLCTSYSFLSEGLF